MWAFISNLRIQSKIYAMLAVFIATSVAFVAFAYSKLMTGEISERRRDILQNKDLLADVLPPPAYVIESYLLVHQMLQAQGRTPLDKLIEKEKVLHRDYEARHAFWAKELPDTRVKQILLVDSYRPAIRFYDLFEKELLPALLTGDRTRAEAIALGPITQAYDEHRSKIDDIVALSNEQNQESEKAVSSMLSKNTASVACLGFGLLVALALLGWKLARVISTPLAKAVSVLVKVSHGDFTSTLEVNSTDEVGKMALALNEAVGAIRQALEQVRIVATTVASASEQLSAAAEEIAGGAQEQAASLEETAASLEEITSTVRQSAGNAQQASDLASGSQQVAEKGGTIVTQTADAMSDISKASTKISDIITTIDELAFQTNLLALNAAVEAARVGEKGRGFAVVATEVRNLAQRSADASREIKVLIGDSAAKVELGVEHVGHSGKTLHEIITSTKRVTNIVSEMATAAREQMSGIEQMNKAVSQLDRVTQNNASQTEELSATARGLASQATQLQELVKRFKIDEGGTHLRASRIAELNSRSSVPRGTSPYRQRSGDGLA